MEPGGVMLLDDEGGADLGDQRVYIGFPWLVWHPHPTLAIAVRGLDRRE
jgi:hypothetical protein